MKRQKATLRWLKRRMIQLEPLDKLSGPQITEYGDIMEVLILNATGVDENNQPTFVDDSKVVEYGEPFRTDEDGPEPGYEGLTPEEATNKWFKDFGPAVSIVDDWPNKKGSNMNKTAQTLLALSDELDTKGLYEEASLVDAAIQSYAIARVAKRGGHSCPDCGTRICKGCTTRLANADGLDIDKCENCNKVTGHCSNCGHDEAAIRCDGCGTDHGIVKRAGFMGGTAGALAGATIGGWPGMFIGGAGGHFLGQALDAYKHHQAHSDQGLVKFAQHVYENEKAESPMHKLVSCPGCEKDLCPLCGNTFGDGDNCPKCSLMRPGCKKCDERTVYASCGNCNKPIGSIERYSIHPAVMEAGLAAMPELAKSVGKGYEKQQEFMWT